MQSVILQLCLFLSLGSALAACTGFQCLKTYVDKDDGMYQWKETGYNFTGTTLHGRYDAYALNLTSQQWLTEAVHDRPVWWHILVLIVPKSVKTSGMGVIWVTGGDNDGSFNQTTKAGYPKSTDEDIIVTASLATNTGMISAALYQIPNQHIKFKGDPEQKRRSEDAAIAWTWKSFMAPANAAEAAAKDEILLRLPMTKAVVKAMDCVTEYTVRKGLGGSNGVTKFGVAGASKRGWTTWTTAAVDKRVVAAVPIVMDELNFLPNINHHYRAYGGWSFALTDYYDLNFTQYLDTPEAAELFKIIDPYWYPNETLTMPKLVVNSGMDEFFLPDDTRYWWNTIPGDNHFLMVPNAEHSQATGILELLPAVGTFLSHIAYNAPEKIPRFSWEISGNGTSIKVQMDAANIRPPTEVSVWHAVTCDNKRRDFRIANKYTNVGQPCSTCGFGSTKLPFGASCVNMKVLWSKTSLSEVAPGTGIYIANQTVKEDGRWTAFFVDVTFDGRKDQTSPPQLGWPIGKDGFFEFTTEVSIIPQTFPFPKCAGESCRGILV